MTGCEAAVLGALICACMNGLSRMLAAVAVGATAGAVVGVGVGGTAAGVTVAIGIIDVAGVGGDAKQGDSVGTFTVRSGCGGQADGEVDDALATPLFRMLSMEESAPLSLALCC